MEDLFEINPLGSVQSYNPQEIPFFIIYSISMLFESVRRNPTWIFRV